MTGEGELHVRVAWDGRRIRDAEVRSSRPLVAGRLLAGRPFRDAVDLVPLLYSICGRSQGIAAAAAGEAAMGIAADESVREARDVLIEGEIVQELLTQSLIAWPELAREPRNATHAAPLRAALAAALAPIGAAAGFDPSIEADVLAAARAALRDASIRAAETHVFGEPPAEWEVATERNGIEPWAIRGGTTPARLVRRLVHEGGSFGASDTPLLPPIDGRTVSERLVPALRRDEAFERAPEWDGHAVETGAMARMAAHPVVRNLAMRHGRSVLVRLVARLAELASIMAGRSARRHGSVALGPGEGAGWVETARGALLHWIRARDGNVESYRILAPTEWNFHPRGALAAGLVGAESPSETAACDAATLLVHALDPCIGFRVEVVDA